MKHQIAGFVTYHAPRSWETEPTIDFKTYDPRQFDHMKDYAVVCEQTIEVEVPDDFDPRPQLVAALVAEKQKIRAEFAAKVTALDAQINQLLCLENTAEAA
jgi:hypothetical protein